jgi:hypothetical protein
MKPTRPPEKKQTQTKQQTKPAASTSKPAPPAQGPAQKPTGPTKGLAKKPAEASSSKAKKKHTAQEVADAFAKGEVTLGAAIGVTAAQKDAIKLRAFKLMQDKRGDLAIPLLEGLVALDPFDSWPLIALAGLKIDAGSTPIALRLLDRALLVKPGDITALGLRSEARQIAGDVAGSKADLELLKDADPQHPAVKRARGLASS